MNSRVLDVRPAYWTRLWVAVGGRRVTEHGAVPHGVEVRMVSASGLKAAAVAAFLKFRFVNSS